MFRFTFGPYGRRIVQHSGEAVFDVFERKFPAISAIYFAQDDANDIDKSLQGRASLARFLMVIVGWWKKATDMCNDLVTENEGPFMGWTDGHAAPLAEMSKLLIVIGYGSVPSSSASASRLY
jgi:hypothetical protein